MQIVIKQDGSFESLSAADVHTRIETYTQRIADKQAELKELKPQLAPLKTISSLKLRMQHVSRDKAAPMKEKIAELREKHGLSPRSNYGPTKSKVEKLVTGIARDKFALSKLKAKAKEESKVATKRAPGDKARTRKTGPAKNQPTPKQRAAASKVESKKEEKIRKLKNDIQRYTRNIRALKARFDRHPNIGMSEQRLERAKKELAALTK